MSTREEHLLYENVNKAVRRTGFPVHVNCKSELYVCLGGSSTENVEGSEKNVRMGDVYVIGEDVCHFQTNAKMFRCCVFQFDTAVFAKRVEAFSLSEKSGYKLLFEEEQTAFVDEKTLLQIEAFADIMRGETDPDVLDCLFLSVVSLICTRSCEGRTADMPCDDDSVGEVIRFIDENFSKKLTLVDLARMTNYSSRHFTRLVRERVSVSPMEYLDTVRINRACDMLANTTLTVSEIGVRCGFDDSNLFSRHFRMRKNMSPTLYRRRAIESMEAKNSAVRVNIVEK